MAHKRKNLLEKKEKQHRETIEYSIRNLKRQRTEYKKQIADLDCVIEAMEWMLT